MVSTLEASPKSQTKDFNTEAPRAFDESVN